MTSHNLKAEINIADLGNCSANMFLERSCGSYGKSDSPFPLDNFALTTSISLLEQLTGLANCTSYT